MMHLTSGLGWGPTSRREPKRGTLNRRPVGDLRTEAMLLGAEIVLGLGTKRQLFMEQPMVSHRLYTIVRKSEHSGSKSPPFNDYASHSFCPSLELFTGGYQTLGIAFLVSSTGATIHDA